MASRIAKPLTVSLGSYVECVQSRVASGQYASASEVVRAGLRALEREERAVHDALRQKIVESLSDPRSSLSQEEVFAGLSERHAAQ